MVRDGALRQLICEDVANARHFTMSPRAYRCRTRARWAASGSRRGQHYANAALVVSALAATAWTAMPLALLDGSRSVGWMMKGLPLAAALKG